MSLKINDIFYTIQGEGKNAGRAALFIRLPFCNLSCPWCDTSYDSFVEHSIEEFEKILENNKSRFAVVTGGEPSMNKQTPLIVSLLKKFKFEVAMESNGQFKAPFEVDHLTISPKRWSTKNPKAEQPRPPFSFDYSNTPSEIKLVVDSDESFTYATEIFSLWYNGIFKFKNNNEPIFYLSPEWNQSVHWLPKIISYVKDNTAWKINLQTHKLMNVP